MQLPDLWQWYTFSAFAFSGYLLIVLLHEGRRCCKPLAAAAKVAPGLHSQTRKDLITCISHWLGFGLHSAKCMSWVQELDESPTISAMRATTSPQVQTRYGSPPSALNSFGDAVTTDISIRSQRSIQGAARCQFPSENPES
ncbi:hypothetical protein N7491_000937 [Penicillium cf. griseofulvum]|nr:hypothetical protein N7445_004850 [Penicillium cf. griseofulvum]KAJ5451755.1 hypothetical protein N7491_000937 [Penicillium cf. griseofulvum]